MVDKVLEDMRAELERASCAQRTVVETLGRAMERVGLAMRDFPDAPIFGVIRDSFEKTITAAREAGPIITHSIGIANTMIEGEE